MQTESEFLSIIKELVLEHPSNYKIFQDTILALSKVVHHRPFYKPTSFSLMT